MADVKIDKIIRSHRRTVALIVMHDASLVIRAPYSVSEEYIRRFAHSKREWIERKQEYFSKRLKDFKPKRYVNGGEFYLAGNIYKLEIIPGTKPKVFLDNTLKMTEACLVSPEKFLTSWYIKQAREIISESVKTLSLALGFKYKSVSINSAKSRWGSCGPKNTLNFSWRLVMAPLQVIDSVVIHELVHTEIKNHSQKFYKRLGTVIPDYKEREKWLKENAAVFHL